MASEDLASGSTSQDVPAPRDVSNRICFVHLPKTAGTTLRHAIENLFFEADILRLPDGPSGFERAITFSARPSWFISGHFPYCLTDRLQRNSTIIYISRDPVERFFSTYWYWRSLPADTSVMSADVRRLFSLAHTYKPGAFLDAILDGPSLRDASTIGESLRVLGQQSLETDTCSPETAAANLRRTPFVMTVENLSQSLPVLLRALGVARVGAIPALNRTPNYSMGADLRRRVEALTQDDLQLHRLARTLEADWLGAPASARSSNYLAHELDPATTASLEIPANGPIYGTGFLPCETQTDGGAQVFWRRFTAEGFTLAFSVKRSAEVVVEIRIVTGAYSHLTEHLLVKVNDTVVPCSVALFQGDGIILINAGFLVQDKVNCLEVTIQTSSAESPTEITLGFSSIRLLGGKLPSLETIEAVLRRASGDALNARTYIGALLADIERKEGEVAALVSAREREAAATKAYCSALAERTKRAEAYSNALREELERKQTEIKALLEARERERADIQAYCTALRDQTKRAEAYSDALREELERKEAEVKALFEARERERADAQAYCTALREQTKRAEEYSTVLREELERKHQEIKNLAGVQKRETAETRETTQKTSPGRKPKQAKRPERALSTAARPRTRPQTSSRSSPSLLSTTRPAKRSSRNSG